MLTFMPKIALRSSIDLRSIARRKILMDFRIITIHWQNIIVFFSLYQGDFWHFSYLWDKWHIENSRKVCRLVTNRFIYWHIVDVAWSTNVFMRWMQKNRIRNNQISSPCCMAKNNAFVHREYIISRSCSIFPGTWLQPISKSQHRESIKIPWPPFSIDIYARLLQADTWYKSNMNWSRFKLFNEEWR